MAIKIFSEPTEILPILDQYPHNTAFIASEHFDVQTKYLRCIYKAGVLSKIEQYLYHANDGLLIKVIILHRYLDISTPFIIHRCRYQDILPHKDLSQTTCLSLVVDCFVIVLRSIH